VKKNKGQLVRPDPGDFRNSIIKKTPFVYIQESFEDEVFSSFEEEDEVHAEVETVSIESILPRNAIFDIKPENEPPIVPPIPKPRRSSLQSEGSTVSHVDRIDKITKDWETNALFRNTINEEDVDSDLPL